MNKTKKQTQTKRKAAKVVAMTPNQIKARKHWKKAQIKAGKCIECTKKAIKNKRTGKRGLRCRVHQDQANVRNQASREKARKLLRKEMKRGAGKHKPAKPADSQAAA